MSDVTIIDFISYSLGDNIAQAPYADLYQLKHGGKVYARTIWHHIFKSTNPNVEFVGLNFGMSGVNNVPLPYAFRKTAIQQTGCGMLGLDYKEVRPVINTDGPTKFNKKKKYVCISIQATLQMKYWNNQSGWDKTVKYLKNKGYDVYCIDKDYQFGIKEKMNTCPKGAINECGAYPIEYRIAQLQGCEFFIGLSSGLAWLAWALNKKVVMISGCTNADNEFSCFRVINPDVCHGCLNDETINNRDGVKTGWMYCPRNKNFECTRQIQFEAVKTAIDQCIAAK